MTKALLLLFLYQNSRIQAINGEHANLGNIYTIYDTSCNY